MKKKLLLLMFMLCMMTGIMITSPENSTVTQAAENISEDTEESDFFYSLTDNGTICITGYKSTGSVAVVIPSEIDGCRVSAIGNRAFYGCNSITSIKIPDSVSSIGSYAFFNCSSLTTMDIPDSISSIGDNAFNGCSGLTSVELPNSISAIHNNTFFNCKNLTSMDIPDSVLSIGNAAFYGCSSLNSIYIPEGVLSIGNHTFDGCSRLTSIGLPDSISAIGVSAFYNCTGLTTIDIPDAVSSIRESAFFGCSALTSIEVPSTLTSIEDSAFSGCKSLTAIDIPDSVSSIGQYAFAYCSSLTSINIPDAMTSIACRTFNHCNSLTTIYMPITVTSIMDSAFYDSNLKDIFYDGTEEEWKKIAISSGNEAYINAATIHFTPSASETLDNNDDNSDTDNDSNNTDNNDGNNNNSTDNDNGNNNNNTDNDNENNSSNTSGKDNDTNNTTATNNDSDSNNTIALGKIHLSKTVVTYNGKIQTPTVNITDINEQTVNADNYIITYTNNIHVGQATVTVTAKNNYTGTLTATFTISPKGTKLSKVTAKKNAFTAKWKKQSKESSGYQLQYSTNKSFKKAHNITVNKNKTISATVKKLKAKKKYFVRIRTYKNVKINGKSTKLYSKWSKAKTVTTKNSILLVTNCRIVSTNTDYKFHL